MSNEQLYLLYVNIQGRRNYSHCPSRCCCIHTKRKMWLWTTRTFHKQQYKTNSKHFCARPL